MMNKISFCTVCMNRLSHLTDTLPRNLESNSKYENVEFILLDYNSNDGLEDYVKRHFGEYLASGKLIFYKTLTPKYFHRSHSRNLAFKLATGNIICNLDADNYTGDEFATFIDAQFSNKKEIYLTATATKTSYHKGALGRLVIEKKHFETLGGYDENMRDYGFEDSDFNERLELMGLQPIAIPNKYLNAVNHGDKTRIENEFFYKNIKEICIKHIDITCTDILFLFRDNRFRISRIIDNLTLVFLSHEMKKDKIYPLTLDNDFRREGCYLIDENELHLIFDNGFTEKFERNDEVYKSTIPKTISYSIVTDQIFFEEAIICISQLQNLSFMLNKRVSSNIYANQKNFGADIVYKNFDYSNPLKS